MHLAANEEGTAMSLKTATKAGIAKSRAFATKTNNAMYNVAAGEVPLAEKPYIGRPIRLILSPPEELCAKYLAIHNGDRTKAAKAVVMWHNKKVACSGFLSGLPVGWGLFVSIPLDILFCIYVQVNMFAALAHIYGFDIHEESVRDKIFHTLAGPPVGAFFKKVGKKAGNKIAMQILHTMQPMLMRLLNQGLGLRLAVNVGGRGVVNMSKILPIVGGIACGAFNAYANNKIGKFAIKAFSAAEAGQMPREFSDEAMNGFGLDDDEESAPVAVEAGKNAVSQSAKELQAPQEAQPVQPAQNVQEPVSLAGSLDLPQGASEHAKPVEVKEPAKRE